MTANTGEGEHPNQETKISYFSKRRAYPPCRAAENRLHRFERHGRVDTKIEGRSRQ